MKKALINAVQIPKTPRKSSGAQVSGKTSRRAEYLIIDMFKAGIYTGRYVLNTQTGEHASVICGKWGKQKMLRVMGFNPLWESVYSMKVRENFHWATLEDKRTAADMLHLQPREYLKKDQILEEIENREEQYDREQRISAKDREYRKIDQMMEEVPDEKENFRDWIYDTCFKDRYMFWDKLTKTYGCSHCGGQFTEKELHKPKQGETVKCPACGENTLVKKRTSRIEKKEKICKLEELKPIYAVARHFTAWVEYEKNGHRIYLEEDVRIFLYKNRPAVKKYTIFYNQDGGGTEYWTGLTRGDWYTSNPRNKRMGEAYLYPGDIREALKGTSYEKITNAFLEMARLKMKLNYNALMAAVASRGNLGTMMEYLVKGRFYRLCKETAENCSVMYRYTGTLNMYGKTLEEVFDLIDRQKINRLRDENGGTCRLKWLRYADMLECKLPNHTLDYLETNRLYPIDIENIPANICQKMSIEQIVNYIKKQTKVSYKKPSEVLEHWKDYLSMMKAQGKSLEEELFYKPKNLKQRHDQLVTDRQKLNIIKRMDENPEIRKQEAEKMEEKFPEASAVMKQVKSKYEYASTEFRMIMPESPIEIVKEGYALHHCAGSSERYFNRIENRETYIAFLRRISEPNIPFYTIEFEPGGTIRQSRSYYDEEPGIEEIRGFLKEWQKEIKKRLTREDREHAKQSALLREENIRELKEKQNSFVLQKLMEDFMEAM